MITTNQAANTLRAYRADWEHFAGWCGVHHRDALPATPSTVATYLADLAAHAKVATVTRRLASIAKMHKGCGFASPTNHADVRATVTRIRRELGTATQRKAALLAADVRRLVRGVPQTIVGVRDAALLLIGFVDYFSQFGPPILGDPYDVGHQRGC